MAISSNSTPTLSIQSTAPQKCNGTNRWIVMAILSLVSVYTTASQVDSLYIRPFEQNFSLRTYLVQNYTSITQEFNIDNYENFEYRTNRPLSIGLGISWNNSSISGSYGFPFMRDRQKGKTHTLAFQYHYYGRKIVLDFVLQRHKGMYKQHENEKIPFELSPDTKVIQYGVSGFYVFNGNRFSYKSAFDLSELQLRSVGSFILGGAIYKNKIEAANSVVISDKHGRIDSISHTQKNIQIGVNLGYAYSWIIKRKYFIAASMTVGASLGTESINKIGKRKPDLYPSFNPRVAIGYHGKEWSVSTSLFANQIYTFYSENMNRGINTMSLQLTIVKRLGRQPKILDKVPSIPNWHRNF